MNVFDANNNFDEWIQNDWESDEWIESNSSTDSDHSDNKKLVKPSKIHVILMALHALYFGNPFISFVVWIITLWLVVKISGKIMNIYFINEYPDFAYLWQ